MAPTRKIPRSFGAKHFREGPEKRNENANVSASASEIATRKIPTKIKRLEYAAKKKRRKVPRR